MSTQGEDDDLPAGEQNRPDVEAPSFLSEDIVGAFPGDGRLIIKDSADDPNAFTRWMAVDISSPFAITDIQNHR